MRKIYMNIVIFVIVVTSYAAHAGFAVSVWKCEPYEIVDLCPSKCNQFCPWRNGQYDTCRRGFPEDCPPPKCVCPFNTRRVANGTCIPTRECPPFECPNLNEEYNPCPSYCPSDDCSQATPSGVCPFPDLAPLVVECIPSCRCKPTYWRKDGLCVPYAHCDKKF